MKEGNCLKCGKKFVSVRNNSLYCSRSCKDKDRHRVDPLHGILKGARKRADNLGLEFTLTRDNIPDVPSSCPLLGFTLERGGVSSRENSPALDRIDSKVGYIPSNVWWISYRANRIKNDATLEELEAIAYGVRLQICKA